MKLGIMQPYFFPYIGYWQLMNAVDTYVIYDDVNFIKGGWINRNRILLNGEVKYFNVPMLGASPFKLINEVFVNNEPVLIKKNLKIIEAAYKKAPYFHEVYPLIEKVLNCGKDNIAEYITESFKIINNYLDIKTNLIVSSSIDKDCSLKGQDKVISICKILGATEYYNAVGGQSLYSFEDFQNAGLELKFLKTNDIEYKQFENNFEPNLSIIDVLMFNSKEEVKNMLLDFSIINQNSEKEKRLEYK